jgi:hypothetical protein
MSWEISVNTVTMSVPESQAAFASLWQEAIQNYLSSTGRSVSEQAIMRSITDADALINYVTTENNKFQAFRSKQGALRDMMKKFFQPLGTLALMTKDAMQATPFPPAVAILGAVAFVIKISGDMSQMYDSVEGLLDHLTSFLTRMEEYVNGNSSGMKPGQSKSVVSVLTCLLEVLAECEHLLKDGRWKRFGKLLMLGEDDKVKPLLQKLERILDNEQRMVSAMAYSTNLRVETKTDELGKTIKETLDEVQKSNDALSDITSIMQRKIIQTGAK